MTAFQKIALLGKGNLGSVLLDELLKAQFTVTVLSRSSNSTGDLPPGVTSKQVDYTSIESLKTALQSHDVVISTITPAAIPLQKPIIDASIQAGVKRFIPAEFGAMSSDPAAKHLPIHAPAVEIQDYLAEKSKAGEIEHTIFGVGLFLELLCSVPHIVDFENHAVSLYDGGVKPFSVSRLSTVAKAVVASLQKPDQTRNRVVRVHDTVLTQRQVFDMAKKHSPGETWSETSLDAEAEVARALGSLQKGFDPALLAALFVAALLSGKYGAAYSQVDNGLLGLGFLSEEEVEQFGLAMGD
ncbi:hypothetical protein BDW62DRAFT_190562, partial [Aspergillus aurantiobrunneus]